ncbi:MAG: hypothetical protein ACR2HI_00955 [Gaiella sp.]
MRLAVGARPRAEFGFALAFLYGFLAFSAGGRAVYQLVTRFDEAPLAVCLSLGAALVYLAACTQLARRTPAAWRLAVGISSLELAGVLLVGTVSILRPEWFPRHTVWSAYGIGYGCVPLVLPAVCLLWLGRDTTRRAFALVSAPSLLPSGRGMTPGASDPLARAKRKE